MCTLQAQTLHDQTLRRLLRKYDGYEISTEGDAFIVVFHLPIDALAWCAATQQAGSPAQEPFFVLGKCIGMSVMQILLGQCEQQQCTSDHLCRRVPFMSLGAAGKLLTSQLALFAPYLR